MPIPMDFRVSVQLAHILSKHEVRQYKSIKEAIGKRQARKEQQHFSLPHLGSQLSARIQPQCPQQKGPLLYHPFVVFSTPPQSAASLNDKDQKVSLKDWTA